MWGSGFFIGIVLAGLFYFFVIKPGERKHHEKRLELMRKKIEQREGMTDQVSNQDEKE